MSGPLPKWLSPVTVPAAALYGCLIAQRNRRMERRAPSRLPVPVISIGNLSTGGVGKTPMVVWCGRHCRALSRNPVVGMRGYGARRGEASDEALEHERAQPEVPVVAHPKRAQALRGFLAEHPEIDCVILDDGFQHRQLHRDLDLVLIDGRAGTFTDRLLPAGHLREPLSSLARADGVVITHAKEVDPRLSELVQRHHHRPPLAWCDHRWRQLQVIEPNQSPQAVGIDWLAGRRACTMLGIARPDHVRRQLEAAGATIGASVAVRDHQRYHRALLERARAACRGLDVMVVTAKDWVKLAPVIDADPWPIPIVVPSLTIEFVAGGSSLEARIEQTLAGTRTTDH